MELSAVLFDVDGTIAETEEFHRKFSMRPLRSLTWIGFGMRLFILN